MTKDIVKIGFWCGLLVVTILATIAAPSYLARVFSPEKAIDNYEWFYDTYQAHQAKLPMIADMEYQYQELREAGSDPSDLAMVRTELTGLKQVCREIASRYNSQAEKFNRALFKSNSLPEQIDMESCK